MTKIFMAKKGVIRSTNEIEVFETKLTPAEVIKAIKEYQKIKGRRSDDK